MNKKKTILRIFFMVTYLFIESVLILSSYAGVSYPEITMPEIEKREIKGKEYYVSTVLYETEQDALDARKLWQEKYYYFSNIRNKLTIERCYPDGSIKYLFGFTPDDVKQMVEDKIFFEQWTSENLKTIVPEGSEIDVAVYSVYVWLTSNHEYELEQKYAHDLITTGKGNCQAFSDVFMIIIREVPFDSKNMTVNYSIQDPIHLTARVVSDTYHSWNAVKYPDAWHFFDPAFDASTHTLSFFNKREDQFYDGEKHLTTTGNIYIRQHILPDK